MGRNYKLIEQLLSNRKIFIELVIAVIVLSLSINLISSCILELKWISPLLAFFVAIGFIIICILYFISRLLWSRTHKYMFQGFICITGENDVVDIPRYDYGHDLRQYLKAAFVENETIKRLWEREPICKGLQFNKDKDKISRSIMKSHQLIIEATEYYVLENLSTHLTDYFNRESFSKQELQTFARNDIPDVLLSNRFLELFSKPMEDRPLFSTDDSVSSQQGEIVMSMGKGGVFYSRFDLTLPKSARVKRIDPKTITIETNRFILKINIDFQGFGTVIPVEFQKHILGLNFNKCHDYQINVDFFVSFKFASLFLPGGWEYYRWIESFMESFEEKFSEERYFKDISWGSAFTLIQYFEREKNKTNEKEK